MDLDLFSRSIFEKAALLRRMSGVSTHCAVLENTEAGCKTAKEQSEKHSTPYRDEGQM